MSNTPNLDQIMASALQTIRAANWETWQPDPGDTWIVQHLFGNQPPLTNGILQFYLWGCTWIWQRPILPLEQQRVVNGLTTRWHTDSFNFDYSWLQEVLSFVWAIAELRTATPQQMEAVRQEFLAHMPDGVFPGIDTLVPGLAHTKQVPGFGLPVPSVLQSPAWQQPHWETTVGLNGLYIATTWGLQLNIYGLPGSGSWGSQTELYGFFPDGTYFYFPSREEAGAHFQNPRGHKALEGRYKVDGNQIQILDARNGQIHTSAFSMNTDRTELEFYGKTFTRIADSTGLRG